MAGNITQLGIPLPVPVSSGGTGDASVTAWAPICGGTTTTAPFQSVTTGMGTAGFVLTSTGATSLPTFQAATGVNISIAGTSGVAQTGPAFTFSGGTTGLTLAGATNTFTFGGTLVVANGGTGAATLTSHGVLLGNGTSAVTATTAGTTGQVLTGVTGGAPTFQSPAASSITITGDSGGGQTGAAFTFTGGTTGLTFTGSADTFTVGGTLKVANGGTGASTLTGILIGNGTSAVTASAITQFDVLVGGASNAITSIAPSATVGVPLISGGAAANPSFGTAVVAGGGTGVTSVTAFAPVIGGTTSTGPLQSASTGISNSGWVLTSTGSSSAPTFQAPGAASITITGDSGGGLTGSSFTFTGGTTGLTFSGSGTTETVTGTLVVSHGGTGAATLTGVLIGNGTSAVTGNAVTQFDVLVGGASNAISSIAPSSTSGIALISQGASANPAFGTVVVAGGGTGATTLTGVLIGNGTSAVTGNAITQFDVLVGGAGNAITSIAPSATSGIPFVSAGSSSNPSFGTAVVAGGGTGITSTTAYAPIAGGTTSTGPFQAITTGLSTAGYVLTSNGASALPSFQASGTALLAYTAVSSGPYTVLSTDYYLGVTVSSTGISILLPNAPSTGRSYVVKDTAGGAATHNITVTTVGGSVNIDGSTSFVMNTNYESVELIYSGSAFEVF
jgi:hypothetical protein